jgi:hypothetical protein
MNSDNERRALGIVIFPEPYDAIKANKLVQKAGVYGKIVTPDPELRVGCCALGLEIDLAKRTDIEHLLLENKVAFTRIEPK